MSVRQQQPQRRRLFAAIVIGLAMPAAAFSAHAQSTSTQDAEQAAETDAKPANDSKPAQTLDKVQVTGSRIKRAEVEGPSPVVVITAEDIKKEGFTTVAEALGTLTQYTGAVVGGEWNFGNQQPDASYLNLRGLGVGYQLILLNGKRMADYAAASSPGDTGISVGSIPAAAVARIEVLSSSASAVYGSDAVAGVVNIITKENWEGNHVRLRAGSTTAGGGDTFNLQFSGGKAWDRGSITYAFEQLNREPIYAWQRYDKGVGDPMKAPQQSTDPNHLTYTPTRGLAFYLYDTPGGYMHYNTWMNPDGTLATASADSPDAGGALQYTCANAAPVYVPYYPFAADGDTPSSCGAMNYYDWATISNKYNKTSAYVTGSYRFTDNLEGYGQLLLTRSRDQMTNRSNLYVFNQGNATDVNLGWFEYQRVLDANQIGGMPHRVYQETGLTANLGVRGTVFDRFDWDTSLTLSKSDMKSWWRGPLTNKVHTWLFGEAIGTANDGPLYNLGPEQFQHMFGPTSAEDYMAMTDLIVNRNESSAASAQFVFSGPLFKLPAGEVEMAFVAEATHSKYVLAPDVRSRNSYEGEDHTFNYNATWGGGSRDRYAAGLELRVPLLQSLTASLAGRYDKYDDISDIAGASTWAAALEWRPLRNLLVRANHQTSFLAPNLMWVYGGPVSSYGNFTNEYLCRMDGLDLATTTGYDACYNGDYVDGLWTLSGGLNNYLHEETAKSDGVGFVWDVFDKLSVSADYWQIQLDGKSMYLSFAEILTGNTNCLMGSEPNGTPVDSGSGACAMYADLVGRDAEGHITDLKSIAINLSGVRTKGFDASVRYAWNWGALGDFNLNAGFTRVLGYDERVTDGDEWQDAMHWTSRVSFRTRTNWTLGWEKDDWNVNLYGYRNSARMNYYATKLLRPYVQWNANVSKKITDNMRLGLDVVNVFDNYGPKDDTYTAFPYYQGVYGLTGRALYINLDIDF
ncbi:MAG: TonB-dependent receptor [Pseudoxanthomonas sp.]